MVTPQRSSGRNPLNSANRSAVMVLLGALIASVLTVLPVAGDVPVLGSSPAGAEDCTNGRSLNRLLIPSCGTLLGSSDRRQDNLDMSVQEQKMGSAFDMVRIYKVGQSATFFTDSDQQLADQGRTIVYSWKVATRATDIGAWAQVARGDHDANLRRAANEIRDSGHTVIFGLHHEPENDPTYGSNADYAAMYRHAYSVMEPIAGDSLVWFINYMGHSTGGFDQVEAMYPGDDIIDWISYNPYNWLGCNGDAPWKSFEVQASNFYDWARSSHPSKPLMIGETATNEDPSNSNRKAQWIADMNSSLQNRFPAIKALLWFHQSTDTNFCERRWDSSQQSIQAFQNLRYSPHFSGGTQTTQPPTTQPSTPSTTQPPTTQPPTTQPPTTPSNGGPANCSTTAATNGVYLSFDPVPGAQTHIYRVDTPGQASRYGEVEGSGAFVPTPSGSSSQIFLSGRFADSSHTPSTNCGTASTPVTQLQCWIRSQSGGVHVEWHPVPGAQSFVYRLTIQGRSDMYDTVPTNFVDLNVARGTTVTIAVGAIYADGSYSPSGDCGTVQAG